MDAGVELSKASQWNFVAEFREFLIEWRIAKRMSWVDRRDLDLAQSPAKLLAVG